MAGADKTTKTNPHSPELVSTTTRVAADLDRLRLQRESAYFNALCSSSSHAVVLIDPDRVPQLWSAGAERIFGYSADEVVGKTLTLLGSEFEHRLAELPSQAGASGESELELRLRRKDGVLLDVQISVSPVRLDAEDVVATALLIRDVSTLKQTERRLHSLGQLEALTRVAGGFAHDINNILTIASTYQGFIAESELTASQAADLKVARDALDRGARLVDRLVALSQNRPVAIVTVDLNEITRGIEETLRRLLGANITLSVKLAPQPIQVRAATGQLDQVLLNLVLNARDAMPNGGKLSIGVRNATVGSAHPLCGQVGPGTYAVLSVEDTGTGIDQATLPHIFDPFFTTKPLGEGTGLGLLIVKDIVSQLGGAIRLESRVGRGTEFEVYLPLFEAQPYTESVQPPAGEQPKKTILVVDEDEALRNALKRMLRPLGYSVLLAADGSDATELATRHEGGIDLLVCDLHMSREDGRQTLRRLQITRPGLRALFMSASPLESGHGEEDLRIVRKPFTMDSVTSAVGELLAAQTSVAPGPLPERPVVLVVDDNAEVRDLLLRVLSESDLVLVGAKSGLHAMQVLEQRHVDLIVADQIMPGMDGVQLLEIVRERWPHCQRVLLTAHASSDVVLAAVNRGGVNKVLTKSMHAVAIRDEIEAVSLCAPRFAGPNSLPKSAR
jgi:two-component system, cell cycle sensor histidine kinase and response regulator CckA